MLRTYLRRTRAYAGVQLSLPYFLSPRHSSHTKELKHTHTHTWLHRHLGQNGALGCVTAEVSLRLPQSPSQRAHKAVPYGPQLPCYPVCSVLGGITFSQSAVLAAALSLTHPLHFDLLYNPPSNSPVSPIQTSLIRVPFVRPLRPVSFTFGRLTVKCNS